MEIIRITRKGRLLSSLEKCHIYDAPTKQTHQCNIKKTVTILYSNSHTMATIAAPSDYPTA
jgi:hypothetical protein